MKELLLSPELSCRTAALFVEMEESYNRLAAALDFSCRDCPDNCCDSYFQHHTYLEWAYLWQGARALPQDRLDRILQLAGDHILRSEKALARGEQPREICPLNEAGRCCLYSHRLMICRLHGIPAAMTRPDGQQFNFPGCFRCQELVKQQKKPAVMDRTGYFQRMVELEMALLGDRQRGLPRVKLTLAQMLVMGPPRF